MKKLLLLLTVLFTLPTRAADPALKPNDFLAICGDSITEQRLYSVFIEDYLLMCKPVDDVKVMQFGWSGERAEGFFARMDNDVLRFKPSIATTCYGMNDGRYTKLTDEIGNAYRDNMNKVVDTFQKNNVRVVVGSPGCVDSFTYKRPNSVPPDEYNKTLAAERDIARQIAMERNLPFADVYQAMYDTMTRAKAKLGKEYAVAGLDGIHPGPNGHLVMAYAFLKALGADGEIGKIEVDFTAKKAQASKGHTIKSFDESGVVTIESTKYPFCFIPDPPNPLDPTPRNSMREIIEFFPFNDELNRLTLVVSNLPGRAKITWGDQSKEFSSEQLAKGINLAAEFLDNPFVEQFIKVHAAVREQQDFETPYIKSMLHLKVLPQFKQIIAEKEASFNELVEAGIARDKALFDAVGKARTPVTHTIRIEAQMTKGQ